MSGKEMDSHNCEDVTVLVLLTQSNQHRATNTAEYGREVTPLLFTSTASLRIRG